MQNKLAVMDVGSNSVRIMYVENEKPLKKEICVTKIAKGLGSQLILQSDAIERTANALSLYYQKAKEWGAKEIYIFATEAVRKAKNRNEFLDKVYSLCGAKIDVVSGEQEALLGLHGALNFSDGTVIDIGGASTEIIVRKNGDVVYLKSLNVGVVSLTEKFDQSQNQIEEYLRDKLDEYGAIPVNNAFGIGGTATSLAGISIGEEYDPKKVHGYELSKSDIKNLTKKLYSLSVKERENLKGLQKERAEVIGSGATLLYSIMQKFSIDKITVSEADNLEGYLYSKVLKR